MPSPDQHPRWASPKALPVRPGHHSPIPLALTHEPQIPTPGLRSGSSASSTRRVPAAQTGTTEPSAPDAPVQTRHFGWGLPRPFRRSPRISPAPSGSAEITTPPVTHIPTWELESDFLRSFDTYEDTLLQALSTLIEPIAQSPDLHDRIQSLHEMGVPSQADRFTWADCLRVRQRLLLSQGDHRPARGEIDQSAKAMNALQANLTTWIAEYTGS